MPYHGIVVELEKKKVNDVLESGDCVVVRLGRVDLAHTRSRGAAVSAEGGVAAPAGRRALVCSAQCSIAAAAEEGYVTLVLRMRRSASRQIRDQFKKEKPMTNKE